MRKIILFIFSVIFIQFAVAQDRVVKLKLIHTTDIHGSYFPYDFILGRPSNGSLARVSAFVKKERKIYHRNLLLFDNGDILQGQPTSYYYNYMDTTSIHLCALMMNDMGYDLGNFGNHDIETGLNVFTRWAKECNFPVLCANAVSIATGEPYFEPYRIFVRDGVKIAVLGMITSAIPSWLSQNIYPGIRFEDMEATAQKWIPIIKAKENPNIIIGLFHSGIEPQTIMGQYNENASIDVATNIPGFDIIMAGHDHQKYCKWIKNIAGQSVLVINPGKNGVDVSNIDVVLYKNRLGNVVNKKISAQLTPLAQTEVDNQFVSQFSAQYDTIKKFVSQKLGVINKNIYARDALVGPSAFVDAIHTVQLELTGADISFSSPFTYDAVIKEGDFTISDLFNLYKYENKLYVMWLTGREIKDYLEESYSRWFNTMKTGKDDLFVVNRTSSAVTFKNPLFNFDSAAGIIYTVDVTKPIGSKINIIKMANGESFMMDKKYEVALNSYRGNGGGELLTKGAGIPQSKLSERIVYSSEKELRYYLMNYIKEKGLSFFHSRNEWSLIPKSIVDEALKQDFSVLFDFTKERDPQ
jgi:2',3'-cyclic-nucleotide 2'-phosphodiesterase/3'-nucleotidase